LLGPLKEPSQVPAGLGHADLRHRLVPTPVSPRLLGGARVGRRHGGRGGKRMGAGRPSGSGAGKKPRTVTPKYGVFDRVLMGIYNEGDVVVAYALATVSKIEITADGCVYTITLDHDGSERKDVEEEILFKIVEAV